MSGDLAGKRLELLKEAVPAARRIAVMMHPDEPIVPIQVRDISATAARIGVELEIISLRHAHELEGAFERKSCLLACVRIAALGRPSDVQNRHRSGFITLWQHVAKTMAALRYDLSRLIHP